MSLDLAAILAEIKSADLSGLGTDGINDLIDAKLAPVQTSLAEIQTVLASVQSGETDAETAIQAIADKLPQPAAPVTPQPSEPPAETLPPATETPPAA